jgi:hypothetical protein
VRDTRRFELLSVRGGLGPRARSNGMVKGRRGFMCRFLVASVVAALLAGGMMQVAWGGARAVAGGTDPSLVGWWKLDDEGADVVSDSSEWGHNGIVFGHPSWVPGRMGDALHFDGLDDFVDTYYYENLPVWTVSAWVISPRAPQQGRVGGPVHHEANYQFNWNHDDSNFQGTAALLIGDTWYPASFGRLFADQWYHLAATFDGSALKAYVDGDLITTNTAAQGVPTYEPTSLKIGRHAGGPWYFEGAVDDVRVYNRALTGGEIADLAYYVPGEAQDPYPAQGAALNIQDVNVLRWSAGQDAVMHDVYFGTDADAVASADVNAPVYRGRQADANLPLPGLVESGGTFFWRVDEVEADGATIHKGPVWNFVVFGYSTIDNFEYYTDEEGHRIAETWIDGPRNGTGSQVAHWANDPIGEPTLATLGLWSMCLGYDNTRPPFISEVQRQFAPEKDWAADGADTLSLWLRGDIVSFGETAPGRLALSGTGTDIWVDGDQFRYAYKRLDGDGAIVAKVESLERTDFWAKAGVMIRESLDPGAAHAFMLVTPDGMRAFQNRTAAYSMTGHSAHSWSAMQMPSWIKLERKGDRFTGYYSADGVTWIQPSEADNTGPDSSPNPQTVHMPAYAYVGLAVTSHAAGAVTTAAFSGVEITGEVIDPWQLASIGVDQPGNGPGDLYVRIEDSNHVSATVVHPDPAAVNTVAWTEWEIPLSGFAGVDLGRVSRMALGVGGRATALLPGEGRLSIDEIRVSQQAVGTALGIYLVDTGFLVLSADDMAAYRWAGHEIVLNDSGIEKWNSAIISAGAYRSRVPRAGGLYQREFVLRIDEREIYRGHFWSPLSSARCEGIVIFDALSPRDNVHNTIQIKNGYPESSPGADDPRANAELFHFLAALGLLK